MRQLPDFAIRKCRCCGGTFPETLDYFSYSIRDGFNAQCKECRKKYRAAQYLVRNERYTKDPAFKERRLAEWLSSYLKNREKHRAQQKKYRSDPDVVTRERKRAREWQIANPDRVNVNINNRRSKFLGAIGKITSHDVSKMLDAQENRCFYCGCDVSGGVHTIDHLIPLSRGGTNLPDNIVIACKKCNTVKGAKTPKEYFHYLSL